MTITKTYKYKLKPTKRQQKQFVDWLGTCRFVYNLALEYKTMMYQEHGISLGKYDLIKELTSAKKAKGFEWIKQVNAQTLQQVIIRLDKAFKSFFSGAGYPNFAKKDFYKSFTIPQHIKHINGRFKLPKIGLLNYFKNQELEGAIKQATIIKEVDGWYICVMTKQEKQVPIIDITNENQVVGVDMGISKVITLSSGSQIDNPKHLNKYKSKLRILQRKLSRQVKGSNNRNKIKQLIAKVHLKIRRCREDFLHKASTSIVSSFDCIVVENLNLQGMTKRAKEVNVKAKSGLNRNLLDVGIGKFFTMLDYKAKWQGKTFVKVDPAYTSQTCSDCGCISKDNRKSQSKFQCIECGFESNADVNAAKNIKGRYYPLSDNVAHLGRAWGKKPNYRLAVVG